VPPLDRGREAAVALITERVDRPVDASGRHAKRVVYLSAQAAATDPESPWAVIEAQIAAAGVEWTVLRPTGIAKNTLAWADQIAAGVVTAPSGDAARSLVDERDIAAVAVRALTDPVPRGKTYALSGPATMTQAEQVRIIGEAIGQQVRWEESRERTPASGQITGSKYAVDGGALREL